MKKNSIAAVADIITEFIRFASEISVCCGTSCEFDRESVSVMRDSLPKILRPPFL